MKTLTKEKQQPLLIPSQDFFEDNIIVLSKQTLELLYQQKNAMQLIALYTFYYYTARWQRTNQPYCTDGYVAERFGISRKTANKYKHELIELGLIENVVDRDKSGKIKGHYIKIKYLLKKETLESAFAEPVLPVSKNDTVDEVSQCVKSPTVVKLHTNALRKNNKNALSNFNSSNIDSEELENEIVDKEKQEERTSIPQEQIINYPVLTPDEKVQAISVKYSEQKAQNSYSYNAFKRNLEKLKKENEARKRSIAKASGQARNSPESSPQRTKSKENDNLHPPEKYAPQIENKTPALDLAEGIESAEYLVESIKVLAEDIGNKLADSKNRKRNITHMTNIFRQARGRGYNFQAFMELAYFTMKDTLDRQNVRNRGSYFYKAFEQRLKLA